MIEFKDNIFMLPKISSLNIKFLKNHLKFNFTGIKINIFLNDGMIKKNL